MSYIAPNSVVELFTDIGLDPNYKDCAYFASSSTRDSYFTNLPNIKKLGTYTALSYTREERGFVRLQLPMSTAIYANYMRFKNTSFENKWFYAFVTNVEYINNEVSQIVFEIDYMTTWMGDFQLEDCFVERMHSPTDAIGDNIVTEGFNFNDYVYSDGGLIQPFGTFESVYAVVIGYAFSGLSEAQNGRRYEGVYSGLGLKAFNAYDLTGINNFITQFNATPDSIVCMYMCKKSAITSGTIPDGTGIDVPSSIAGDNNHNVSLTGITAGVTQLDGYTPRNNKLYTYPYNFVSFSNGQGNSLTLRYEFFTNLTPQAQVCYNVLAPVSDVLRPFNYNKSAGADPNRTLTLTGYPVCSWTSDTFEAWFAQNVVGFGIDVANAVGRMFDPMAMLEDEKTSALTTICNFVKSGYSAAISPDMVHGNVANGNNIFSSTYFHFWWHQCSIPASIASMIDSFFDAYGYAQNRVMHPRLNARRYWTYLKTQDCHITKQNLPAEHAAKIEEIIDKGCRFWTDISNIGDFSLINAIV